MPNFTEESSTDAVIAHLANCDDPRLKQILAAAVRHLHEFTREVRPSHAEWLAAIRFLTAVGKRSDERREEFILLSDTLGVSALVDVLARGGRDGATESTVLGPFYVEDVPIVPDGAELCQGRGEPVVVTGRVADTKGRPIARALVDAWQTDGDGFYDNEPPPGVEALETRGRFRTDGDGRFWFRTVKPVSYSIPTDGPAGELVRRTGRNPFRPAHIHFMLAATGYETLVTHLFVAGDPHLADDPVFAVKPSLIEAFPLVSDADEARRFGVGAPFRRLDREFRLQSTAT